ncbi:hypothetical protein SLS55_002303 [Diplodia seriata]|uniref:Uncharacterized protein n=1 Tax=Diplodia seriata TaxID=420778 RepID=A0ABR3CRT2_9PEZI
MFRFKPVNKHLATLIHLPYLAHIQAVDSFTMSAILIPHQGPHEERGCQDPDPFDNNIHLFVAPIPPPPPPPPPPSPRTPQILLTPVTAIPGRIVFITEIKKDSIVWETCNIREEAQGHPAVILSLGSANYSFDEAVQVLPLTSWNGLTKEEKWNRGRGVEFRSQYLLIDHGEGGPEGESELLSLEDGKQMRTRSYVSIRDDSYIIEHAGLVLYTDAEGTDSDFFLTDDSLKRLVKKYRAAQGHRLSRTVTPE